MDYDSRMGVMMGHQEDSESDLQLRPEKVKPSSTATVGAQKIRGELGDNVNRAFDTHDSMAPQPKDSAPHTEYVG